MSEESFKPKWILGKEGEEKLYIDQIKKRVEELQNEDINLLFSYLYRLDIEERRIKEIIKASGHNNFAEDLALEIWSRQKERMEFKKSFPVQKIDDKTWDF